MYIEVPPSTGNLPTNGMTSHLEDVPYMGRAPLRRKSSHTLGHFPYKTFHAWEGSQQHHSNNNISNSKN